MNFIYLCTRNYLKPTLVSIRSVLNVYNNRKDELYFHIFSIDDFIMDDYSLVGEIHNNIHLYKVTNHALEFKKSHPEFSRYFENYSDIAFLKLYVPDYMLEYNIPCGVYMDVDTIMIDTIDDAYKDIPYYDLQAVQYNTYKTGTMKHLLFDKIPELKDKNKEAGRINDGVLYINAKKMMDRGYNNIRGKGLTQYIDCLTTHLDVDIYSLYFIMEYCNCKDLSDEYNFHYKAGIGINPKILHYVNIVPWSNKTYPFWENWYEAYHQIKQILDKYAE